MPSKYFSIFEFFVFFAGEKPAFLAKKPQSDQIFPAAFIKQLLPDICERKSHILLKKKNK